MKCKTKIPWDVNHTSVAIAAALFMVLEQVLLSRLDRYLQTANLSSRLHMEQTWLDLHSSKRCIFIVVRTHRCAFAFVMLKMHFIGWVTLHWQRSCKREILQFILWNCFFYGIEQELLVRWGTHCPPHFTVQMESSTAIISVVKYSYLWSALTVRFLPLTYHNQIFALRRSLTFN